MLGSAINGAAFNRVKRYRSVEMSATDSWAFTLNMVRVVETSAASTWNFTINGTAQKLTATAASSSWAWTETPPLISKSVTLQAVDTFSWGQSAPIARNIAGLVAADSFGWTNTGSAVSLRYIAAVDSWAWQQTAIASAVRYLAADSQWNFGFSTPQIARFVHMGVADSWGWSGVGSIENNPYAVDAPSHTFARANQQREFTRWAS